ncbi:YfbR-like 5'-deoxynucleotidase, partial [Ammoniphilus sp. 3BR4]|uniref:YfbR-like 5'-deoxynucleotidase n=1 Tax=Ammoniphilus sp. 3BR4 TaxID=3158265 RepID=UPI003465CAED
RLGTFFIRLISGYFRNSGLSNFREIEHGRRTISKHDPNELKTVYQSLILEKEQQEIRRWVKAADLIDAYLKCVTEESAGNREFSIAKEQIKKTIQELNIREVYCFLTS